MTISHDLIESFDGDMLLRGYRPRTMVAYGRCVRNYLAHSAKSSGDFGETHARRFLLHLVRDREASPAEHKMHAAALECFYEYTLDLPDVAARLPIPKVPQSLPDVLSGTEVDTLLAAVQPLKHRVVIVTTYAAGLRIEEACGLNSTDIDSKRMVIHVHRQARSTEAGALNGVLIGAGEQPGWRHRSHARPMTERELHALLRPWPCNSMPSACSGF